MPGSESALALGKAAEVLAISDDEAATVRCGVDSTVELSGVESLDGQTGAAAPTVVKVKARTNPGSGAQVRTSRNTLDVRGMRVHEAEAAVEEQLRGATGLVW